MAGCNKAASNTAAGTVIANDGRVSSSVLSGRRVSITAISRGGARMKASSFELKVNGAAAPFSTVVNEGDELELKFGS